MKTATGRELRNNFSKILRWIGSGEEVQVTRRGTPVAKIVSVEKNVRATRARKARTIPSRIADTDPETEEIRRDPQAMAAINAHRERKITRWHTMEEAFGD